MQQKYTKQVSDHTIRVTPPFQSDIYINVDNPMFQILKKLNDFEEREKPKLVIQEPWCPDLCPNCKTELSESLGDGYYTHPVFLTRCHKCLQNIVWDKKDLE